MLLRFQKDSGHAQAPFEQTDGLDFTWHSLSAWHDSESFGYGRHSVLLKFSRLDEQTHAPSSQMASSLRTWHWRSVKHFSESCG